MSLAAYDAYVEQLTRANVAREAALRAADQKFGGRRPDPDEQRALDTRLEKQIEAAGDRLMQSHGFEVIRFSHQGKTRQTEGIPDRRYYLRPRVIGVATLPNGERHEVRAPVVVWVEYKAASGRQRPGQRLFQELADACGEEYVLGGLAELTAWLARHGFAVSPPSTLSTLSTGAPCP